MYDVDMWDIPAVTWPNGSNCISRIVSCSYIRHLWHIYGKGLMHSSRPPLYPRHAVVGGLETANGTEIWRPRFGIVRQLNARRYAETAQSGIHMKSAAWND